VSLNCPVITTQRMAAIKILANKVRQRLICHDDLLFIYFIYVFIYIYLMSRESSVDVATELRAGRSGDRIPVEGERFSAPFQTCPETHPASYTMGTGSKAAGA